jgi:protein-arginine kinase
MEKNELFKLEQPWSSNDNPIWIASTVRINRNIEKFNFPSKLDTDKKKTNSFPCQQRNLNGYRIEKSGAV